MRSSFTHHSRGFTLIELLTVIAIIGILAAIIIPTVGRVRASAQKAQCASNQRQLAMGVLLFADDNKGALPFTNYGATGLSPVDQRWHAQIRNYIIKGRNTNEEVVAGGVNSLFQCPADRGVVENAIQNPNTGFGAISYLHMLPLPLSIRENSGNSRITTMNRLTEASRHPMLIDARNVGSQSYLTNANFAAIITTPAPADSSFRPTGMIHGNNANVAFYDGSVRNVVDPTWTTLRGFPN